MEKIILRRKADELGFFHCGFSKATFLEEEAPQLEAWLKMEYQGEMHYMNNHFDKRLDPRLLVDGAKTVISLLFNYYPQEKIPLEGNFKLAKYAYGEDYHHVVKDKLKQLVTFMKEEIGDFNARIFVDSAPVMDKVWAKKAGLGWIGKHTNLVNPKKGSFFFITEIILDVDFEPDVPMKDYCGTCTRCIDACPTDAIVAPYQLDARKCISYATIELKSAQLPDSFQSNMDDWIFGCDICQDVCPWNRFSTPHNEPLFEPHSALKNFKKKDWEELNEVSFREVFKKSAVKRTKLEGLKRNIAFQKK
ncbi:MAG: hypothetical protein RL264_1982 [Bacteroidota bacterium]|jgi:epoxyqueuosine reductase